MAILQIETLHVDKHSPIDRRVGAGEHPRHGERIVHLAVVGTMRGGKAVPRLQPQLGSHRRPEHAGKKIVVAEVAAGGKREGLAIPPGDPVEEGGVGADDPKSLEVVPHADRHSGFAARGKRAVDAIGPFGRRQKLLVELPGNVLDRLADEIHAVEHQLQRAPLRPHDHVVAEASPRLESLLHQAPRHQRGDNQRHPQGQREGRQQ